MRLLQSLVSATCLLSCCFWPIRSEEALINCQDFTADFKTADSCMDGSQPSSGPIPSQPEVIDDSAPFDDGFVPMEGITPGFWE
ncbi:MAG: hypothetical protein CMN98_03035 [Synechococcus sp. NP17]|nr:hypothetical protein [Synechococcus sp. NP17]